MKLIMYGSPICKDCVNAKVQLEKDKSIELDYKNITEDTKTLKEFLAYRDHDTLFTEVINEGRIGIPFFILEDGTKTFEIDKYINFDKELAIENSVNACSIDGKGIC